MKAWKWFGDLDNTEKTKAREVLAQNEHLRGRKLGWDGTSLLGYERPPIQYSYLLNDDGSIPKHIQVYLDKEDIIDTNDGGCLFLVKLTN